MGVSRIFRGTLWLLFDRAFRMAIGFGVGILIARHYGPGANGELAYVVASSALFGSFASLGLDELGPRDFAAEDSGFHKADMQRTAIVLRFVAGAMGYGLFFGLLMLEGVSPEILLLGLLYGVYLPLQATDIVEYRFRSEGRFGIIARLRSFASLASGGLKLGGMSLGAPLPFMALAMTMEYSIGTIGYGWFGRRQVGEPEGRFQKAYARRILRRSFFLILAGTLALLQGRIELLLVEHYLGLQSLGQYAAALKLMEVFDTAAIILSIVLIPEFARQKGKALEALARKAYLVGCLIYVLTIPAVFVLSWGFPTIYGPAYREGQILLLFFLPRPLLVMMGFFRAGLAVAEGRQRLLPLYPFIGILTTTILSLILIPAQGLKGAALSAMGGLLISNALGDLLVYRKHLYWMISSPLEWRSLLGRPKT